uniref:MULE transposase domain-containing protein n=1 Tax=Sipha flava TaxID=143950 RepID=A0A2S2QBU9_9HEMI
MSIAPEDQTISKLSDYILETYIDSSIFSSEICAKIPDNEIMRTTNAAESFHRHLKDQFYVAHCSVHIVIEVLLKLQSETYLFMNSPPNKLRIFHEEIIVLWKKYQDGEINCLEYVKKVGLKN